MLQRELAGIAIWFPARGRDWYGFALAGVVRMVFRSRAWFVWVSR